MSSLPPGPPVRAARGPDPPGADTATRAGGDARPRAPGRVALRFAAGASIPFAAWLVLLPALGAWGAYAGGTIARPIVVLAVACAAGGVVAGGGVGGLRWRNAFGAAFCVAGWIPLLLLSTLPALGGRETAVGLAVVLAPGFAVAHAALAAAGLALGGAGWRDACRGAAVFGAAGAVGGALLAGAAGLAPGAVGLAGFAVHALGGGAASLLPPAAGGWWIGREVRPRLRR